MAARLAGLLLVLTCGCTSGAGSGSATATATGTAAAPTPGDHVLMIAHDECVGLAAAKDCANAAVACAKAVELHRAARVEETDKWFAAVLAAQAACAR